MSQVKLTFLGTGTSQGVPIIGCQCEVCRSADIRDKRFRASVLVEYGGLTILVDAGPDFRMQMLSQNVRHLDAILLTHNHKDHTGGLDDVRSLNYIDKKAIEIYCEERVEKSLRTEYSYAFAETKYPGAPEWNVHRISTEPFTIHRVEGYELEWIHDVGYSYVPVPGYVPDPAAPEVTVVPIRGYHDTMPVLGFRFGPIAYITDMNAIPESEFAKLEGLEHVTLNTVGYKKHHSHFSLDEAIALGDRIGARHTWLTHLSHSFPPYAQFESYLASRSTSLHTSLHAAYDGLILTA